MFSQTFPRDLMPAARGVVATGVRELDPERQATMTDLLPYFLAYITHELRLAPETIGKYQDCMRWIVRMIGDLTPQSIKSEHVLLIKARCAERRAGPSRVSGFVYALKAFLRFCRLAVGVQTIDPKQLRAPRLPKHEVIFLTPEEIQRFVSAIPLRTKRRTFDMTWLGFRALVEVLLGTGMRISEALSLKRSSIDMQTGEATIIGKGSKERTVFFSARALNWVREYVTHRSDSSEWLFVVSRGKPLRRATAMTYFRRFRKMVGIKKKITAHVLRHTVATTLLFNGCPIGHIKEILGHENLMTTCNFYLGADKRAAKEAHRKYLDYDEAPGAQPVSDLADR